MPFLNVDSLPRDLEMQVNGNLSGTKIGSDYCEVSHREPISRIEVMFEIARTLCVSQYPVTLQIPLRDLQNLIKSFSVETVTINDTGSRIVRRQY